MTATLLKTPKAWPTILLERAGAADPLDLDAAVKAGAFEGLRKSPSATWVRWPRSPRSRASGLRGRGGAGFPTGPKWRLAAATEAPRRYVVANGYGADPASGTDRALLTLDPFAIVEGVAIAAVAIGATESFIAVRAEDTAAIRSLEAAIGAATDAGFIGFDVPGLGHDLMISVRPVQGAYMLGEETVLLKALEGKRGQPEQRPPHPAERGLHGMPTVVHNVQTLAALGWILRHGADAFAATGAYDSPGTVLVQVRTPGRRGHRRGPVRDAAARHRGSSAGRCRPAAPSRRCSSAGRPAACCRRTCWTRPTRSTACARPAPTSAPGPWSSPTIAPASWTWPAS